MNRKLNELEYGYFVTSKTSLTSNRHYKKQLKADVRKAEKTARKNAKIAKKEELKAAKKARLQKKHAAAEQLSNSTESVKSRHSIGTKLIVIISALVIVSLGMITVIVSHSVSNDTRISAEENNRTINRRTADDTENRINSVISSAGMFLDLLQSAQDDIETAENTSMFFKRNQNIAAIVLPETERTFLNTPFFIQHELDTSLVDSYIAIEADSLEAAEYGTFVLKNASPVFNTPVISMFYPIYNGTKDRVVIIIYSSEELSDSFSSGSTNLSFFINNEGEILIHPDISLMMDAADVSKSYLVQQMADSKTSNSQITYREDEAEYIGAFKKFSNGNGAVLTIVKSSVILEAVNATTRRNVYLTIAVLSLAILIIYMFSKSLSSPLRQLTAVADEINRANFNTDLFETLNTNRKDEIGVLIKSTQQEREILNTFTKLTNKGVTEAIVLKKIDFEPHLKDITIFFSDIRGFTAISDGFKNRFGEESAAEIIGFLNDYMSRMVTCITNSGGTVDKFEGDAIMACWGVLRNDDLDCELTLEEHINKLQRKQNKIFSEEEKAALIKKREDFQKNHAQHVMDDAISAIKASIAMRYSLMKYNKDAEAFTEAHKNEPYAKYKPHIRIGSGLNTGRATVGFMGSFDKMEFTSIGDAVNFASRTEASNKPCGTDLLITEDTYNLLKKRYIRCEENNFTISEEDLPCEIIAEQIPVEFEVKGKGTQHFYAVVNLPNFNIEEFFGATDKDFVLDEDCKKAVGPEGPKNMHEVRAMLGIPEPDFGGVNLDAEENKIQVKGADKPS